MLATRLWSVAQCCLKGMGACAIARKSVGGAPAGATCGDYSIFGASSIMSSIAEKARESLLLVELALI